MTLQEIIIMIFNGIPISVKGFGILIIVLSLVQVSKINLNPWTWVKSMLSIPKQIEAINKRIDGLERKIDSTDGFRWQSMILVRGDRIRRGEKFSEELWRSTIKTLDNYDHFCEINKDWFNNGETVEASALLRDKYKEVYRTRDYLV